MIQKDVKDAIKKICPSKKVNRETKIKQIFSYSRGWETYGKTIKDFVKEANEDPQFFYKITRINVDNADYGITSILYEWDIVDVTEFGPIVNGYAFHPIGWQLDFDAAGIEEMRKIVKEICKEHGWAFLDGGGPLGELKAAYLELARKEKSGEI